MVKRVIFGEVANANVAALADVGRRELVFLVVLAVLVLWMGLHPKPFSDVMNPTIQELLRHVAQSKVGG
jgi:NADH-quinone oxidoreductase subunit M